MTPEQAFKSGGRNPKTGLWVHEWYACGSVFMPRPVLHEGKILLGIRQLTALDMASHFCMDFDMEPEAPDTLRANRLIPFLERVGERHGRPSKGWVISHSSWLSSLELALDDDTAQQGRFLEQAGIEFGPMSDRDKREIEAWGAKQEISVIFDADQIS